MPPIHYDVSQWCNTNCLNGRGEQKCSVSCCGNSFCIGEQYCIRWCSFSKLNCVSVSVTEGEKNSDHGAVSYIKPFDEYPDIHSNAGRINICTWADSIATRACNDGDISGTSNRSYCCNFRGIIDNERCCLNSIEQYIRHSGKSGTWYPTTLVLRRHRRRERCNLWRSSYSHSDDIGIRITRTVVSANHHIWSSWSCPWSGCLSTCPAPAEPSAW